MKQLGLSTFTFISMKKNRQRRNLIQLISLPHMRKQLLFFPMKKKYCKKILKFFLMNVILLSSLGLILEKKTILMKYLG